MGKPVTDLRNQRFEALLVCDEQPIRRILGNGKHRKNRIFWRCVCDCGNEKVVRAKCLVNGDTGSCGCLRGSPGKRKPARNIQKYDYANPAHACHYANYWQKAKNRGIEFALLPADFVDLVESPCFYCGEKYQYSFRYKTGKGRSGFYTFLGCGVDRISSDKPYTLDNVVPACKNCNFAKMELSQAEFFSLIEKIYNRHCVVPEGG